MLNSPIKCSFHRHLGNEVLLANQFAYIGAVRELGREALIMRFDLSSDRPLVETLVVPRKGKSTELFSPLIPPCRGTGALALGRSSGFVLFYSQLFRNSLQPVMKVAEFLNFSGPLTRDEVIGIPNQVQGTAFLGSGQPAYPALSLSKVSLGPSPK